MSDFKAKMHQIRFPLGLYPRPRWGSLQRSPRPLAVFKGATSKGGRREKEKWRVEEGRVAPQLGMSESASAYNHTVSQPAGWASIHQLAPFDTAESQLH